jgi:glycerol-3-phosphate O-acyltransferase
VTSGRPTARAEIAGSTWFADGCAVLAEQLGRTESDVRREAEDYLAELVAERSPFWMERMLKVARRVTRRSYGERPDYDEAQIEQVRQAIAGRPAVLLPSHKSMLDGMVTKLTMCDHDLPMPLGFGGSNLDIWPLGEPIRKGGTILVRRATKTLPVYRWVLREYLGWLIAEGEMLEWYLEGGRSRTGKLLPPKLGLLTYVVDAYHEGRADDVVLLPMSIVYDQLSEVGAFAAESRGEAKKAEGLGWALGFLKGDKRRYGRIHVRFGPPMSLREQLGPPGAARDGDGQRLALQKLGFEVSARINSVTPITAGALVTLVLLAADGVAMTLPQLRLGVRFALQEIRRRDLPVAWQVDDLDTAERTLATVEALVETGVVRAYADGPHPVYVIGPDQFLAAAFYRNTAIHHFLAQAIAEVALAHVAETQPERGMEAFWDEALRLRDLLKFEFFVKERDEFVTELSAYLDAKLGDWRPAVSAGGEPAMELLRRAGPQFAHLVLRSFLEAYMVLASELVHRPAAVPIERANFLGACQRRGRQYVLQRRVHNPESVSEPLFSTGLQLAEHRGLLTPGPQVGAGRSQLNDEIHEMIERLNTIQRIAIEQFTRDVVGAAKAAKAADAEAAAAALASAVS